MLLVFSDNFLSRAIFSFRPAGIAVFEWPAFGDFRPVVDLLRFVTIFKHVLLFIVAAAATRVAAATGFSAVAPPAGPAARTLAVIGPAAGSRGLGATRGSNPQ